MFPTGRGGAASSIEERVYSSLRDMLLRNASVGTATGYAALVGMYLIDWDQGAHHIKNWWCLALLLCLLGRTAAIVFQVQQRSASESSHSVVPYYLYYGISIAEGVVWGSAMFVVFPVDPLNQAFLLIVLIAIAVGAMATFTGSMSLYAIYSTTMVFMAFIKLVSMDEIAYQILGWLCWALLTILLVVANRMNGIFADLIRLSIKNEQLALIESASKQSIVDFSEKLASKTTEVEKVTAQLKGLVRILSHDLRTHLITLCDSSQLLQDAKGPLEDRAFVVQTLQRSAVSGLQLVDDIIQITGVGETEVVVDLADGSIQDIVSNATRRVKGLADGKGVQVYLAADEKRSVKVDIRHIEDVLTGLMERAVKRTPSEGSVTVQTTPTQQGLRVEVIDTGAKMDVIQISRLFERPQGLLSGEEGHSGSLAILQDIVKAHNSRIEVTPNTVTGCCYSFVLPWA